MHCCGILLGAAGRQIDGQADEVRIPVSPFPTLQQMHLAMFTMYRQQASDRKK